MAKKVFTNESLATLVDETKSYVDNAVSNHSHSISNVINLQSSLDAKVDTTEYEEYKEEVDNDMSMIKVDLKESLTIAELPYLISEADTTDWTSFTYGDGKYLAVGIGVVSTSTDGVNWSSPIALPVNGLYNICTYGNGKFVLISNYNNNELGVPIAVYSEDTITWNYCELPISDYDNNEIHYKDIAFSNDKFILLAIDSYGSMSIYSNDCINWSIARITNINQDTGMNGLPFLHVCYGNGKFVAVTEMVTDEMKGASAVSTDGINWTVTNLQLDLKLDMSIGFGGFTDIAYGNGKFVAIAPEKHLLTSSDGVTWNVTTALPYLGAWKSIAHNGDKFVAIVQAGELEKPFPAYSDDGETWMISNDFSNKNIWTHIIEGNGKFIVISEGLGELAFSDNGVDWTYAKKSIATNYGENKTEDIKEILNVAYIDKYDLVITKDFDNDYFRVTQGNALDVYEKCINDVMPKVLLEYNFTYGGTFASRLYESKSVNASSYEDSPQSLAIEFEVDNEVIGGSGYSKQTIGIHFLGDNIKLNIIETGSGIFTPIKEDNIYDTVIDFDIPIEYIDMSYLKPEHFSYNSEDIQNIYHKLMYNEGNTKVLLKGKFYMGSGMPYDGRIESTNIYIHHTNSTNYREVYIDFIVPCRNNLVGTLVFTYNNGSLELTSCKVKPELSILFSTSSYDIPTIFDGNHNTSFYYSNSEVLTMWNYLLESVGRVSEEPDINIYGRAFLYSGMTHNVRLSVTGVSASEYTFTINIMYQNYVGSISFLRESPDATSFEMGVQLLPFV